MQPTAGPKTRTAYLVPVRSLRVDVVELTERLLADEGADRTLEVCADQLEAAGLTIDRRDELSAIVARRGQDGLALSGHVDVVPAGEEWSRDPFGNEADDDRLYGRGASDMRGPVACMLAAVERTDAPVTVVLTTDEETTMETARELSSEGILEDAPLTVVGEPTGLDVATIGKGVCWIRVVATGDRGHASTPRGEHGRGPSAPERLVEALAKLDPQPIRASHPDLGPATAAISGIESEPTPFNALAGRAEARIDCRFPPPSTPDDVERSVSSKLGLPTEGLEIEMPKKEPAFLGDEELGAKLVELFGEHGIDSELVGVVFASEAGHWQRNGATLICGPGSIDRAHGPDEYVTLDELEAGVQAYAAMLDWSTERWA